jgi:hypothetical protein
MRIITIVYTFVSHFCMLKSSKIRAILYNGSQLPQGLKNFVTGWHQQLDES